MITKRTISAMVVLIAILLQGCSLSDHQMKDVIETTEPKAIPSSKMNEVESSDIGVAEFGESERISLFLSYIEGNTPCTIPESGKECYIDSEVVDNEGVFYTFYDVDHDEKKELNIKTPRSYHILREESGKLYQIYLGAGYDDLLNDGTVLSIIHETGDSYTYVHTCFGQDGQYNRTQYGKFDANHDSLYDSMDNYDIDGEAVPHEEFEAAIEPILNVGKEQIEWTKTGGR